MQTNTPSGMSLCETLYPLIVEHETLQFTHTFVNNMFVAKATHIHTSCNNMQHINQYLYEAVTVLHMWINIYSTN